MQTSAHPESWFRNIKKMHVMESVDYYTHKGRTTIIITYKSWWKSRRKLRFPRVPTGQDDGEAYGRHPEATAIIKRIKEILDPTLKTAHIEQELPSAPPRSALPSITGMPRFAEWPTAK